MEGSHRDRSDAEPLGGPCERFGYLQVRFSGRIRHELGHPCCDTPKSPARVKAGLAGEASVLANLRTAPSGDIRCVSADRSDRTRSRVVVDSSVDDHLA